MNNYWLNKSKYTDAVIQKNDYVMDGCGQWTISRQLKEQLKESAGRLPYDFMYVLQQLASDDIDTYYLHKDGKWHRNSTYADDGPWQGCFKVECFTGYYATEEEALAMLHKYC